MTEDKPILIGEAPGRSGPENCYPLYPHPPTSAGGRLFRLTPFATSDRTSRERERRKRLYVLSSVRLNLVTRAPASGSTWPRTVAEENATNLVRSGLFKDRTVLLMGKRVLRAFCAVTNTSTEKVEPCEWFRFNPASTPFFGAPRRVALVPHPSGKNLWFNDDENKELARKLLLEAFGPCPEPGES